VEINRKEAIKEFEKSVFKIWDYKN
jgi:hypothetical protein